MPIFANIKAKILNLVPVDPNTETIDNNSVYADSTNNGALITKDTSGTDGDVQTTASDQFRKVVQSGVVSTIPANTPVARLANGKVAPADSDDPLLKNVIGVTIDSLAGLDSLGVVFTIGPNLAGALSGVAGLTIGDDVFVSQSTGFTNDIGTLDPGEAIIKLGIADVASGVATTTPTDLIFNTEIVDAV